jgi:RimJ/RimL family protein N-acetyltransferase
MRGLAKGYRRLEMSWVLENNLPMNRVLQKLGARIAKTYRLYEYRL